MGYILPRFHVSDEDRYNDEEPFADDEGQDMVGFDFRDDIDRRRAQFRREVGDMDDARRSTEDFGEPLPR